MVRTELVKRSPLRILEQSIHGGLGKGNIGVIAAPKGIGKTACLIHIATDQLLEGKHIIHVSFAAGTNHIISWYEDIFTEIARRYHLDEAMEVHDDIIKNRVIINFRQDGVTAAQVGRSIRSMIQEGNFNADAIIIDGYDFSREDTEEFGVFKGLAEEAGLEIWFSASLSKEALKTDGNAIPAIMERYLRHTAVFIILEPCDTYIKLKLVKDHEIIPMSDLHLKLDPHILLIAEEVEV